MVDDYRSYLSVKKPVILSLSGFKISPAERRFFAQANPFGFILFQRNCDTPDQVSALVRDLRGAVGWHCPILIDQEGGRVQRLKPPHWPRYECAQALADPSCGKTIYQTKSEIAQMLKRHGIDVNCDPVMDVAFPGAHDVIGDRAYSEDPLKVAQYGMEACQAYSDNGVIPVIKHLPGHGRGLVDSHHDLPVIEEPFEALVSHDFLPFREVCTQLDPQRFWGMAAHIIYTQIDPDLPATLSHTVIDRVIRGEIGFKGLLLTDDIEMKALDPYGDLPTRSRKSLEAGCDVVLYCGGKLDAMDAIVQEI